MGLIRLLLFSAAAYLLLLLAFPQWEGHSVYHAASLSVVAGAAVGVWLLLKAIDLGSGLLKLGIELAFAVGVLIYFGTTMPQKSGQTPLEQWSQGKRPIQNDARDGMAKLGIDSHSKLGGALLSLFPVR